MNRFKYSTGISLLSLLITLSISTSCSNSKLENTEILRFEKDLFSRPENNQANFIKELKIIYPDFLPVFCTEIISIGPDTAAMTAGYLNDFCTDPVIRDVFEMIDSVYPDFSGTGERILSAVRRYENLSDRTDSIKLITYLSGFNQSFVTLPGILAVGLDNYLGSETPYYQQLAIPKYVRASMSPDFIEIDALRAWIISEMSKPLTLNNLLDNMIYQGRILYLMKKSLPGVKDYRIHRYSEEQLNWCYEHEGAMWKYLVENELLYSSDNILISRLTNEAPFVREFGRESPGRAGSWIGYRIVENYMKKTGTKPSELIKNQDTKTILSESRYNPN